MSEKKKGRMTVIREYFGYLPGQTLRTFSEEMKKLTDADKDELAIGAARNLGLSQDEVDFNLG